MSLQAPCLLCQKYDFELKSVLISPFAFQAPSQPPGNVVWNATDTKVLLNWEQVKAMENESEVTGYKVSGGSDFTFSTFTKMLYGKLSGKFILKILMIWFLKLIFT